MSGPDRYAKLSQMKRPGVLFLALIFLIPAAGAGEPSFPGPGAPGAPLSPTGSSSGHPYRPDQLLVRFKTPPSPARLNRSLNRTGAIPVRELPLVPGLWLVRTSDRAKTAETMRQLSKDGDILYVEPNYIWTKARTLPDDPRFNELWGMEKIAAPEAWSLSTGSNDIVVGVIDTGVDYNHPDLKDNMWKNSDGTHGYNVIAGNRDPFDDNGHGTHVAGTIGAVGNNSLGVAGVSWNVRIMALKFLGAEGYGDNAGAIECINFAIENGAHILNNSWGGGHYSRALYEAIEAADRAGVLFVAAAGNGNWWGRPQDLDLYPFYPASYNIPNVVAVASTSSGDSLSSFSNYGAESVHLAAPGSDILSTIPSSGYRSLSGTSMAAPHVSGLGALLLAYRPDLDPHEIKRIMILSSDRVDSLTDRVVSGGRINAWRALTGDYSIPAAPRTIFQENFDNGLPDTWKVVDGGEDGKTWTDTNPGGRVSSHWSEPFMIVDSDWAGQVEMDEQLITPSIDCSGYEDVTLSFNHYFRHYALGGGSEKGDVDVSVDGGPWINVARYTRDDFGSKTIDISELADGKKDVRVRWRYRDAFYDWYWGIDNVVLSGCSVRDREFSRWYFPSGGTRIGTVDFENYISLYNPSPDPVDALIEFLGGAGPVGQQSLTIDGEARLTIRVENLIGGDHSHISAVISAERGIFAERATYWTAGGTRWRGGHGATGINRLSTEWYFAEGSTHRFDHYLHLLNPDRTTDASVNLTFFDHLGASWSFTTGVAAGSNLVIRASDLVGERTQLSAIIESDLPIAADRAGYWPGGGEWTGGHASAGARQPATTWHLAEGATHLFDHYVLVANPSDSRTAQTRIDFLGEEGLILSRDFEIGPRARLTVKANDLVGNRGQVAVEVRSLNNVGLVAERTMFWPAGAPDWEDGHSSLGASAAADYWVLAEGATHIFGQYVLIYNPSPSQTAEVRCVFLNQEGEVAVREVEVGPGSRATVNAGRVAGKQGQLATIVRSLNDVGIIVERAMYWNPGGIAWGGGHGTVGIPVGD